MTSIFLTAFFIASALLALGVLVDSWTRYGAAMFAMGQARMHCRDALNISFRITETSARFVATRDEAKVVAFARPGQRAESPKPKAQARLSAAA